MRRLRNSAAFAANRDPAIARLLDAPNAQIYAIDVSFSSLDDPKERAFLNDLPTSFALPPDAVDRLRAAAGRIIRSSPEFQRLLEDTGLRILPRPSAP